MRKQRIHQFGSGLTLVAGLVACLLPGCGDGAEPQPANASEAMCRGLCNAGLRCELTRSLPACVQGCSDQWWSAARTDPRAASMVAGCLERKSCDSFGPDGSTGAVIDECWSEAQVLLEPTAELRRFCGAYSLALFECGALLSVERCERIMGMWAPFVHDHLGFCLDAEDCAAIETCISNFFEPPP